MCQQHAQIEWIHNKIGCIQIADEGKENKTDREDSEDKEDEANNNSDEKFGSKKAKSSNSYAIQDT